MHKIIAYCLFTFSFPVVFLSGQSTAQTYTDIRDEYVFRPIPIGGGGWVTGVIIHPLDSDIRYARTDVGGAWRWDANAGEWVQMVTAESLPQEFVPDGYAYNHPGIESIGVDPTDPLTVYMGYESPKVGTGRGKPVNGRVYCSTDGGRTWRDLNVSFDQNPNSKRRMHGERIGIDPLHPNTVSARCPMASGGRWTHPLKLRSGHMSNCQAGRRARRMKDF